MREWRDDGLAGWRVGGLAGWRVGRLTVWQVDVLGWRVGRLAGTVFRSLTTNITGTGSLAARVVSDDTTALCASHHGHLYHRTQDARHFIAVLLRQ